MKVMFVDTGGWMMLTDASDPGHAAARSERDAWMKSGGVFVTTDYVADETLTLLRMRLSLDVAEAWWHQVEGSARVQWEWVDPERAAKARETLFRWRDKDFSFTDCTSFVVMRERKVKVVLTSDHHFTQAGFERRPK